MCGRFALTLPMDAMAGLFDVGTGRSRFDAPRYNIAPTTQIPVVVNFAGENQIVDMRWGFIPHWYKSPSDGPLLINARSETITEKPAFRAAFETRRGLIRASGFYEWRRPQRTEKGKEPFFIQPQVGDVMAFGGIWQAWTDPDGQRQVTCSMITQAAGPEIDPIHHREPLVIGVDDYGGWLKGDSPAKLFHPEGQSGYFKSHRVDPEVNGARSDHAGLMAPIQDNLTNSES